MSGFVDALRARVLLADGAMGTLAAASGVRADGPGCELVLLAPELVAALHRRYVEAGAEVIQTHTYGGSRLRLARHGLARRVTELNVAAVRLARSAAQATDREVFVAGSVSPATSPRGVGPTSAAAVDAAIREQVTALAEGGADVVALETFTHADELARAVEVARASADLPVIAQVTFVDDDGNPVTTHGETPEDVVAAVAPLGPAVLGSNCTLGPQGLLAVVRRMAASMPTGAAGEAAPVVSALPNAGLPHVVSDRSVRFASDAAHFGRYAAHHVAAGARLVGGCCGTTPAHVVAAAEALRTEAPPPDPPEVPTTAAGTARARPAVVVGNGTAAGDTPDGTDAGGAPGPGRGAVARWLDARPGRRRPLVVAEVGGPGPDVADLARERGRAALAAGASVLWAGRERSRRPRTSAAALAVGLGDTLDVDVALTVTSWNTSRMALQADLLGLDALGVHTLVCETGNPPVHGDRPVRDGVWEVDAVGLVGLAAGLARGVDADGLALPARVPFRIGVRVTPGSDDLDRELRRVAAKVAAGAEFVVTRPVYELDRLRRVREGLAATGVTVPVLVTVAPLSGFAEAEHLRHEVPDVVLPDEVLARARAVGEDAAAGRDLAAELVGAAVAEGLADGIVLRSAGPADALGTALERLTATLPAPAIR